MKNRFRVIVLLVVAVCVITIRLFKTAWDEEKSKKLNSWVAFPNITNTTCRSISKELGLRLQIVGKKVLELQEDLGGSSQISFFLGNQFNGINDILKLLKHDTVAKPKAKVPELNRVTRKQEVCPERFAGKDLGYGAPYYRLGYERVKCDNFVPISALLTLLIYAPVEYPKPAMSYKDMMGVIAKDYPDIKVVLATEKELPQEISTSLSSLKISLKNVLIKGNKGSMWTTLLDQVETPYVLIAPYISHFDDDIDLYRLVRVLSYREDVAVAGGSYRNLTGHWDLGCRQVSFNYWTAKYTAGYYRSFNECVVCDHLPGPFAAKTQWLKSLQFDTSLSEGVFYDIFWRMKHSTTKGDLAVVCADVMFNIGTPKIHNEALMEFATKHDIKKMVNSDGSVRWFGCRRGLSYTKGKTCTWPNGIGAPPCDLWNLGEVIKFVMQICEESNIMCEYVAGDVIGAVQFGSTQPWQENAEIFFHTKNFTAFSQLRPKFENATFTFSADSSGLGSFSITTKHWVVNMRGRKTLQVSEMLQEHKRPTRILISGAWVQVPRNPGIIARGHYLTQYYSGEENRGRHLYYSSEAPKKCPNPQHSACLDQYPIGGNVQYLKNL